MRTITGMTALIAGIAIALACLAPAPSRAAEPQELLNLTASDFLEIEEMAVGAKGRPNEEARWRGLKSYTQGRYVEAADAFQRAAYYADKFSQHYLSLMHWHGIGVERDPVAAYIWADLAAERMGRNVLLVREKIWQQLAPAQREQAAERGPAFYARYGDEVAKPRTEAVMRQFARDMTGSRVGYRNQPLDVLDGPSNGSFSGPGSKNQLDPTPSANDLYGKEGGLARLATYWQQQDVLLEGGKVEVGPLSPVREQRERSGGPSS